jgi:hypothetical protein
VPKSRVVEARLEAEVRLEEPPSSEATVIKESRAVEDEGGVVNVEPPSSEATVIKESRVVEDEVSKSGSIKEEPSWSCWVSGRGRGRRGGQAALQVGHYAARI